MNSNELSPALGYRTGCPCVLPPIGGGGCRHHGFVCGAELHWQLQAGAAGSGSTKEELGSNVCLAGGTNDARRRPLVEGHWVSWEGRRRGRPEAVQVRADFLCAAPGFVLSQIQFDSRRSSGAREIDSICLEFSIFGFPPSLPASCAVRHVAVGLRVVLGAWRFEAFAGWPDQPVGVGGGSTPPSPTWLCLVKPFHPHHVLYRLGFSGGSYY